MYHLWIMIFETLEEIINTSKWSEINRENIGCDERWNTLYRVYFNGWREEIVTALDWKDALTAVENMNHILQNTIRKNKHKIK